jgi:CRISPR/Cas system CSM-associated protein Csm3 (group 7 of RAMP superfamily)
MQAINIKFNIETLEDFHIGTGLDCVGLYDDGQVKDKAGDPYINPETLKGLLKQSCLEVKRNLPEYQDAFDEIFWFKNLGSLDIFVDYKGCGSDSPFIIHTFTAIDQEKGTGKDGSLRDIEFGSKGCKFEVKIHFEMKNADKKDKVKKLLELGVKNLKWMGGYRRRGFGAISCDITSSTISSNSTSSTNSAKKTKFRIFLELLDDTCFAGAGQTGNIIHSLDYITGTSALGMLRNPLLKLLNENNLNELSFLDDGKVSVTNFYPVAEKWNENLKSKIVIPAPSSLRKNKGVDQYAEYYCDHRKICNTEPAEESKKELELPQWALDAKPKDKTNKKLFKNFVSQDTLIIHNDKDQDEASDKSISGEYLIFPNNAMKWEDAVFFKPKKNLIMRNRITESTQSTDDDGIFTQEMIEKGTIFAGDIEFKNQEDSKNFQTKLKDWLSGEFYFHTGRGGKPLKVRAVENVIDLPEISENKINKKQFTLTLLSDVILYDEKLMPETVIHPEYLKLKDKVKLVNYVASNRIHQSFSGLAGLRRFSDRVIAKGSCFLYELEDGITWESIQSDLMEIQKHGVGFKKDEGFGQAAVNLSIHQVKKDDLPKVSYDFEIGEVKQTEFIKKSLEKTDADFEEAKKFIIKYPKDSKTFTNRIIAYMEANKKEQEINDEIDKNIQKNTRAADNWKVFNEKIWKKTKDYKIIRLAHLIMKQEGE